MIADTDLNNIYYMSFINLRILYSYWSNKKYNIFYLSEYWYFKLIKYNIIIYHYNYIPIHIILIDNIQYFDQNIPSWIELLVFEWTLLNEEVFGIPNKFSGRICLIMLIHIFENLNRLTGVKFFVSSLNLISGSLRYWVLILVDKH